jgi:predicted  nucleic acid-binding Zn-ribbon protein
LLQLDRQADDAWYIAYQDESTQWCSQKMALEEMVANLGVELGSRNLLISELKRTVEEEKKNSELIRKEKWTLETDLAILDHVVEDLKQDKARVIQELEVKAEEKTRFMMAVFIVAISVLAVLLASCGKVWQL